LQWSRKINFLFVLQTSSSMETDANAAPTLVTPVSDVQSLSTTNISIEVPTTPTVEPNSMLDFPVDPIIAVPENLARDDDCILVLPPVEVIDLCGDGEYVPDLQQTRIQSLIPLPIQAHRPAPAPVVPPPPPEYTSITCSICLESAIQQRPVTLVCGHIYCKVRMSEKSSRFASYVVFFIGLYRSSLARQAGMSQLQAIHQWTHQNSRTSLPVALKAS
jgi:hypothetical protein